MKKLIIATGNKGKVGEIEDILKIPLEILELKLDEVQSMDLEYVARKKVEEAYKQVKNPVITDDVAVYIEAWNNFPGPFVKYVYSVIGIPKLLEILKNEKNRNVIVKCAVSYHDGEKVQVFIGEVKGKISNKQLGSNGWGFDPVIIPNGYSKTFAQMTSSQKNKISHRGMAFASLKKFLDSQNRQKEL